MMARSNRITFLKPLLGRNLVALILCFILALPCSAQLYEGVQGFLDDGIRLYNSGKVDDALIEFENALLIDATNFEAKVWLSQIAFDRKDFTRARRLLRQASKLAPGHPRIQSLSKLLNLERSGGDTDHASIPEHQDLIGCETIAAIASDTRLRRFGLVITNTGTRKEDEPVQIPDDLDEDVLPYPDDPIQIDQIAAPGEIAGPLREVFTIWDRDGLNPALDLYFSMLIGNPELASENDRNLLQTAYQTYSERFENNPDDDEARYYMGMLNFFNGMLIDSGNILEPLRKKRSNFPKALSQTMDMLDARKRAEEARALFMRREQERIEAERQAAEMAEKAEKARLAKIKDGKPAGTSGDGLHEEGQNLYRRGKIDEAIEKFNEAIKINSQEPKYYYHLGLALTDKALAGDMTAFDTAVANFNRVIQLEPGTKLAQDSETMIRDIMAARRSLSK